MERSLLRWYWKRVSDTVRYEGFHILLWRMLKWCFSTLGHLDTMTFYRKDLTQALEEKRAKVDLTVTQASESDIDQLAAMVARRYGPTMAQLWPYKNQSVRDILQQRFRRGCKCFVAKIGTEMVHYNWIFFHWEEEVMGTFSSRLQADEAICNDGYTEEVWRGKGVHTAVNSQMLSFLKHAGYRRAYTSVGTDSKSSRKALDRLGWEVYGTMLYFIPRGACKAWIFRLKGTLEPLMEKQTAAPEA